MLKDKIINITTHYFAWANFVLALNEVLKKEEYITKQELLKKAIRINKPTRYNNKIQVFFDKLFNEGYLIEKEKKEKNLFLINQTITYVVVTELYYKLIEIILEKNK